jgi:hypothetical protein
MAVAADVFVNGETRRQMRINAVASWSVSGGAGDGNRTRTFSLED